MPALHILVLVGFAALLAAAAYTDLRRFEIPNAVPVALVVLYPAFLATAAALPDFWPAVFAAMLAFAAGGALFAAGLLGGGDVKLFAAVTLWVGTAAFADFFVLTALAGGVLGVVLLTRPGAALAGRLHETGIEIPRVGPKLRRPMPYGVAIALAGLVTVLPPVLS